MIGKLPWRKRDFGISKMIFNSDSPISTLRFARAIGPRLQKGDILCLYGELGSGKTVFSKGLAEGLGIKKKEVISPSFVLIREHLQGRLPFYHFDLYRLKDARSILALGYEEYLFGDGVCVIEWADRLKKLRPKEFLKICLRVTGENSRAIEITACGKHYQDYLYHLRHLRAPTRCTGGKGRDENFSH
ncbi:MAG: tRNA (adenosine(37)-N6)-threonylcarbamoyltransferase complex ATPase subunit type 1 TsaE [Candidatus Omnitrophota bacterium]